MLLAIVNGLATATVAHPSLRGQRIVLCSPINESGAVTGSPVAALDPIGAGRDTRVFITTDGSHTQQRLNDPTSPLRNEVVGLVD